MNRSRQWHLWTAFFQFNQQLADFLKANVWLNVAFVQKKKKHFLVNHFILRPKDQKQNLNSAEFVLWRRVIGFRGTKAVTHSPFIHCCKLWMEVLIQRFNFSVGTLLFFVCNAASCCSHILAELSGSDWLHITGFASEQSNLYLVWSRIC